MTAASRGPNRLSIFSEGDDLLYRTRREPFLFSVLGQAAMVVIIIYFSSCIVVHPPVWVHPFSNLSDRLAQGIVVLLLVVGKDGHPYNVRLVGTKPGDGS